MGKALSKKQKKEYQEGLIRLTEYAEKQGLEVQFGDGYIDEIHDYDRLIRINSRYRVDTQLFGLAHELGHWLIRKDHYAFSRQYPLRSKRANRQLVRTKAYIYEEIKEEYEAWARGKKLLNRLGIYYDENNFLKCEQECVFTYIDHAANSR